MKYLLAISIIYIIKAVIDIFTGSIIESVFEDHAQSEELAARLDALQDVMDVNNDLAPIVLAFGRLCDPTIRRQWSVVLRKLFCMKPGETPQLTDSLKTTLAIIWRYRTPQPQSAVTAMR